MATFNDFIPFVLNDLPGVPDPVLEDAARQASRKFFQMTNAYRARLDPITLLPNINEYDLDVPDDTVLQQVLEVRLQGRPLRLTTDEDLAVADRDWLNVPGHPTQAIVTPQKTLMVGPIPTMKIVNGLTVSVSLRPSINATTLDDQLFEDYAELIIYGVKAELQLSKAGQFVDPQQGMVNQQLFEKAIRDTKLRIRMGNASSSLTVRLPRI